LVAGDAGDLVTLNNASAITLTIPTNATVAFATGTQITIAQLGAGQVTVAGAVGVTISAADNFTKLRSQYSAATLIKTGTNSWILIGDITA
jgi:beta-lactamase superfamily II metal-dependent hydrolase